MTQSYEKKIQMFPFGNGLPIYFMWYNDAKHSLISYNILTYSGFYKIYRGLYGFWFRKKIFCISGMGVRVMVFIATFNHILVISWRWVLLVEETRVLRENHRPVASHWQTLSHVLSSTPRRERHSNSQR